MTFFAYYFAILLCYQLILKPIFKEMKGFKALTSSTLLLTFLLVVFHPVCGKDANRVNAQQTIPALVKQTHSTPAPIVGNDSTLIKNLTLDKAAQLIVFEDIIDMVHAPLKESMYRLKQNEFISLDRPKTKLPKTGAKHAGRKKEYDAKQTVLKVSADKKKIMIHPINSEGKIGRSMAAFPVTDILYINVENGKIQLNLKE